MEPFSSAFCHLKSTISNLKVEIKYGNYIVEKDGYNDMDIDEIYAAGMYPTSERFEVIINDTYHATFLDELVNSFNNFTNEIKNNLKIGSLKESVPSYFEKLSEELIRWYISISECEVKLDSHSKWIYLSKDIDQSFLSSENIESLMCEDLDRVFKFIKLRSVEILDDIENFKAASKGNEIDIPDEMFSDVISPQGTTGVLDIFQTALLFAYLKKHRGINPLNARSLAKCVSALTGHSEQNIRTDKGFGVIANIYADKEKNLNFKDIPNYNLNIIKTFLKDILDDIEIQAKKNHPELTIK